MARKGDGIFKRQKARCSFAAVAYMLLFKYLLIWPIA